MKAREALQWVAVIGVACIAMAIVIALIGASDTPMIVFWLMGALLCVGCASYMMYRYYQLLTEIRTASGNCRMTGNCRMKRRKLSGK